VTHLRVEMRGAALTLAVVGLGLIMVAVVLRQQSPRWAAYQAKAEIRAVVPSLTGQKELCLTCHWGIEEISPSHPVEVMGCVACHGGVGTALEADLAHTGLVRNPGDLAYANQACGGSECHSGTPERQLDHIPRVERSIQATYAGAIALIRRTFGLQPDGTAHMGISAAQSYPGEPANGGRPYVQAIEAFQVGPGAPPLVDQFADRCLTCHLQSQPVQAPYFHRATGCSACHVLYDNDGLYKGSDPTISKDEPGHMRQHRLTTAIPYTQCNHCHNRGNYELPTMSFVQRADIPAPDYLTTTERREQEYYQPIGQYTKCEVELDCVDCHTRQEVMGDGYLYSSKHDARYVQCQTCHGTLTEPPLTTTITDPNDIALRLAFLNPTIDLKLGDTVVMTSQGEPLPNVVLEDGSFQLTMKATGDHYTVPLVMNSGCQQRPDQQESQYCHECHAYQPGS
jgi:hypothetical protein